MTKKQLIEKYISEMDSANLRTVLSDKYLYNTHFDKNHFIDILEEEVFLEFKKIGDTYLKAYAGSCQGNCCVNIKCKGIAFVGNQSKDVLNIIFIENETEYIDIFSCSNFRTFQSVETNICHCIPTLPDNFDEAPF